MFVKKLAVGVFILGIGSTINSMDVAKKGGFLVDHTHHILWSHINESIGKKMKDAFSLDEQEYLNIQYVCQQVTQTGRSQKITFTDEDNSSEITFRVSSIPEGHKFEVDER